VESGNYSDSNPLMPQIETLLANKMSAHIDNKTRAAGLLGITKPTLYSRLRSFDRLK
jgi:DNA-binding protein Fis